MDCIPIIDIGFRILDNIRLSVHLMMYEKGPESKKHWYRYQAYRDLLTNEQWWFLCRKIPKLDKLWSHRSGFLKEYQPLTEQEMYELTMIIAGEDDE